MTGSLKNNPAGRWRSVIELLPVVLFLFFSSAVSAQDSAGSTSRWYDSLNAQWGGHIKFRGASSWMSDETIYQLVGAGTYLDGSVEGRLKNQLSLGERFQLETHYEMILYGGDTRTANQELAKLYPGIGEILFLKGPVNDAGRFFDLTAVIAESDDAILYNRLDRLSLTYQPEWGLIRVGRQAVTWGNGLLFNPMDLFNPFAPTDVDRDYKLGDDLLAAQFSLSVDGNLQLLLVPRRDPTDGNVESDQSSLGGKLHLAWGATEFNFMVAKHYSDDIVGLGGQGYFMNATWRLDATYTFLDEQSPSDDFLSLVANLDYAWVWAEKNFYGFVEFFFSGIGEDNYSYAISNPDILKRLFRGELFTLGRTYLSGMVQMEIHPLFNIYLTVINNTEDPSGIIQPRAAWDIVTNLQLTFGGTIYYGDDNTEYGGYAIPGTSFISKPAETAYVWLTYYF